jgi:hypothetical protein
MRAEAQVRRAVQTAGMIDGISLLAVEETSWTSCPASQRSVRSARREGWSTRTASRTVSFPFRPTETFPNRWVIVSTRRRGTGPVTDNR